MCFSRLLIFSVLVFLSNIAHSQLLQIPHAPSNEMYDLHIDKKGFVWVAHNLGVSRYDGISFTSFTNPNQTALSMTDLVEDKNGRIWCHNFNGQIFYIQNEKMYYLKEYDFRSENVFPRMSLLGDELLITSRKGLFVCNTNTLKCRYITSINGKAFSTSSLCVVNNRALLSNPPHQWFAYSVGKGLDYVTQESIKFDSIAVSSALQPHAFGDTVFVINIYSGAFYGFKLTGSKLVLCLQKALSSQFNTICNINGSAWLNTKAGSFSITGNDSIIGYNLTSAVADKEKNIWFSSLSSGLLVKYKNIGWKNVKPNFTLKNDYIKCIKINHDHFIACSQYGEILMPLNAAKDSFSRVSTISLKTGTVENVQIADPDKYFIEMSNQLYLFNTLTHQTEVIEKTSVKDVVAIGDTVYMAASAMMRIKDVSGLALNSVNKIKNFSIINPFFKPIAGSLEFKKMLRCRALMYDTITNSLLASFTDGLQRIKGNAVTPVSYNGQQLYVSSMARYGNKIYAATFNSGLFVITGNTVSKIESNIEAPLDAIVKLKCCNNHLWIFRTHDIEILNTQTDQFIRNVYPFPTDASDITDVEEDENNIYLASGHGMYSIPLSEKAEVVKADIFLLHTFLDGKDTVLSNGFALPNYKNNLLFRLAIPLYKNADRLHFKYQLRSKNDNGNNLDWYYTNDEQRDIQFNALKPGSYTLEVLAVKDNEEVSIMPFVYSFSILPPWYNSWWFYTSVILGMASIFFAVYQYRLRQALKIEQIRRKISTDLHDDIGSTLSSINVYSQLAKTGAENNEYISTIQSNTIDVINSLDDLVWNINPRNDTLDQLLSRMQMFALPLLREKGIECRLNSKIANRAIVVSPAKRVHIYLLFKEMVNNVIKHSGAAACSIYFIQKGSSFRLTVNDNGRGFNVKNSNRHRNGLYNMQLRVKDIKGTILITSEPGKGTEIKITCRIK